jgi:hypothetical protein
MRRDDRNVPIDAIGARTDGTIPSRPGLDELFSSGPKCNGSVSASPSLPALSFSALFVIFYANTAFYLVQETKSPTTQRKRLCSYITRNDVIDAVACTWTAASAVTASTPRRLARDPSVPARLVMFGGRSATFPHTYAQTSLGPISSLGARQTLAEPHRAFEVE